MDEGDGDDDSIGLNWLEPEADFITLWDFGVQQCLVNAITGESCVVDGSGCVLDGGPWTLQRDDLRQVLVGKGTDEDMGHHDSDLCYICISL